MSPPGALTEVTSEMQGHDPIIRHHADFSLDLRRGKAVQLQVGHKTWETEDDGNKGALILWSGVGGYL